MKRSRADFERSSSRERSASPPPRPRPPLRLSFGSDSIDPDGNNSDSDEERSSSSSSESRSPSPPSPVRVKKRPRGRLPSEFPVFAWPAPALPLRKVNRTEVLKPNTESESDALLLPAVERDLVAARTEAELCAALPSWSRSELRALMRASRRFNAFTESDRIASAVPTKRRFEVRLMLARLRALDYAVKPLRSRMAPDDELEDAGMEDALGEEAEPTAKGEDGEGNGRNDRAEEGSGGEEGRGEEADAVVTAAGNPRFHFSFPIVGRKPFHVKTAARNEHVEQVRWLHGEVFKYTKLVMGEALAQALHRRKYESLENHITKAVTAADVAEAVVELKRRAELRLTSNFL